MNDDDEPKGYTWEVDYADGMISFSQSRISIYFRSCLIVSSPEKKFDSL